jgi:hypothetical protein
MELPPYLRLQQSEEDGEGEGPGALVEEAGPSSSSSGNNNINSSSSSSSSSSQTRNLQGGVGAGAVAAGMSAGAFVLRVLHKESKVEVASLQPGSSVLELKEAVAKRTEVPVAGQRLIFSGKHLNPESRPLSDFGIASGASIHLFPRLVNAPSGPPSATAAAAAASDGVGRGGGYHSLAGPALAEDPWDPAARGTVRHAVPEVRLWCYILFFSSFMTLFNHLSFVLNTGKLCLSLLCCVEWGSHYMYSMFYP